MDKLIALYKFTYNYCTDFVINIANMLDLSYYEINFIIFCILFPLFIIGLTVAYFIQKLRLKKLVRDSNY